MVIEKNTLEQFYIGFEYSSPDLESGETIIAVDVSVDPAGLTLSGAGVISGNEVSQFVIGGISGISHIATFKTAMSSGNVFIDKIKIKMK